MTGTCIQGTSLDVEVVRAVDGDSVKVLLDGEEENLRVLGLDAEESSAGSDKPKTPWGQEAKSRARDFFPEGSTATIEFPGDEPLEECLRRYRGNYGRPLVYLHKDGKDFQEVMIREGYSPYFTKYGYAHFEDHHRAYTEAERQAQADGIGVWNQLEVNGAEMRDYESLKAWWDLRAESVESFRAARRDGEEVYDTRLDYAELETMAGERATVFTELRSYSRVGASHVVVEIGSHRQPFKLFLPDAREREEGRRVLSLLDRRYVAEYDGRRVPEPLRSYAFVTGGVKLYRGEPEVVVESIEQITDGLPEDAP